MLDDESGAEFNLAMSIEEEREHLITLDDSLFLDQIGRIDGDLFKADKTHMTIRVPQVILVEARKNPKKDASIRRLIKEGFAFNGERFVRYGKSASQAKAGITLFVSERIYDELFDASTLGILPEDCVISKYEAQRCLTLSSCTIIQNQLPYIVIVDEYTKTIPGQYIRYVAEETREITDKSTGEQKNIKVRAVKEGIKDIQISPFDGCGCHDKSMSELWSAFIGLDYTAVGYQIRLPFFKGYSVEVPFKEYYREHGVKYITDIFGKQHCVDMIDCIWNTSMWKASGRFQNLFGAHGWDKYIELLERYEYKLGISKYSHHKKDLNLKTRLNFQYLQCLDLWDQKYIDNFYDDESPRLNLLEEENWGSAIRVARYTTQLYERIIQGDKMYSMKFLGMLDTATGDANGKYLEAVLINDAMLRDACIQRYIYRKVAKSIEQAKFGKIYADGFFHTVVGDMIGYLEFAAGEESKGCLAPGEFFCDTLPQGDILSFRSPLVCPSEVNAVRVVKNDITRRWFERFRDQDVVMLNMYDLSMPQQGGMKWRPSSLLETAG